MTPDQLHGLLVCFSLSLAFALLTPTLWWVLPNRWS